MTSLHLCCSVRFKLTSLLSLLVFGIFLWLATDSANWSRNDGSGTFQVFDPWKEEVFRNERNWTSEPNHSSVCRDASLVGSHTQGVVQYPVPLSRRLLSRSFFLWSDSWRSSMNAVQRLLNSLLCVCVFSAAEFLVFERCNQPDDTAANARKHNYHNDSLRQETW